MNIDVRDMALDVVLGMSDVVRDPGPGDLDTEFDRLHELRLEGEYEKLAARVTMLIAAGWGAPQIAINAGVSRVTVDKWIRTHAASGLAPAVEEIVVGVNDTPVPLSPVMLPRQRVSGLAYHSDKFVVPDGFVDPLRALWRIAYRSRGDSAPGDGEAVAVSDALDVVVSLLLRRGVTNVAIARAAEVTHRAVISRMIRARGRGLVMECDDHVCEAFVGEDSLLEHLISGASTKPDAWADIGDPDSKQWVSVSVTRRPGQFWARVMTELATGRPLVVDRFHGIDHVRMSLFGAPCPCELESTEPLDETWVAARLGRLSENSDRAEHVVDTIRTDGMLLPAAWVYTDSVQRPDLPVIGRPSNPDEALATVPLALARDYLPPGSLAARCFTDPQSVIDEYPPTTKHALD